MWECNYAREPIDYRLIWIRFFKKIGLVILGTIVGALLVCGIHYLTKYIENGGRANQTTSIFYCDFAEDSSGKSYDYFNYYTWSEVIHYDFFVESALQLMADGGNGMFTAEEAACAAQMNKEKYNKMVAATVDADVRFLYVRCTSNNPAESTMLAKVMEQLIPIYGNDQKEFIEIRLVKAFDGTADSTKLRPYHALGLGALLGFLITSIVLAILLITDTAVYLPSTLEKRYGVPTLGAPCMPEYSVNCEKLLKGRKKLAVISVDDVTGAGTELITTPKELETDYLENPITNPDLLKGLSVYDGVVLCVEAGVKNGPMVERCIEELNRLGIEVTATVLVEADAGLLQTYYRGER